MSLLYLFNNNKLLTLAFMTSLIPSIYYTIQIIRDPKDEKGDTIYRKTSTYVMLVFAYIFLCLSSYLLYHMY